MYRFLLLIIACLFAGNVFAAPTGKLRATCGGPELNLPSFSRSAVVLIHGWNPPSLLPPFQVRECMFTDGELPELVNALSNQLPFPEWKLRLFDWSQDAATGPVFSDGLAQGYQNAADAAENSEINGALLAELINDNAPDLRRLILVAHSAGSWAAREAAVQLLVLNPYLVINVILLDPFIPGVPGVDSSIHDGRTVAKMTNLASTQGSANLFRLDNYFATDDATDVAIDAVGADNATSQPFNWEILNPNHLDGLEVNYDLGLGGYTVPIYAGHSGPIKFYTDTVVASSGVSIPEYLWLGFDNWIELGFFRSLVDAHQVSLPKIDSQPVDVPADPGQNVTFTVQARRATEYAWFKVGNPNAISFGSTLSSGPTLLSFAINSVSQSHEGAYVVRLENSQGYTFSDKAVLTIGAPQITSVTPSSFQGLPLPSTQRITINGSGFSAASRLTLDDGINPPYENRIPIYADADELQYDLTPGPNAGTWQVRVTDSGKISAPATLYVLGASVPAGLSPPTLIYPGEAINSTHSLVPYGSITYLWNKNNTGAAYLLSLRDITGFADDVGTSSGSLIFNGMNVGDVSSYNWTGGQPNKKYRWQVDAQKPGLTTVSSARLVFTTQATHGDTTDPTVPAVLYADTLGTGAIQLSWTRSTDSGGSELAGYKIERCTSSGCTNFAQIATTPSSPFTNAGLNPSTTYRYRVRAYDNEGNESDFSGIATATTAAVVPLPDMIVYDLTAPATVPIGGHISSSYTIMNVGGGVADGFRLKMYFSTDSTITTDDVDSGMEAAPSLNLPNYPSTTTVGINLPAGLSPGPYYFGAFVDDLQQLAESNENNNTTSVQITVLADGDITAPTDPVGLSATATGSSSIDLIWGESTDSGGSGLAGYKIQRCNGDGCGNFFQIATTTSTSFSDTGLNPNTTYGYRVRAYDNAGYNSNPANATATTTAPLPDLVFTVLNAPATGVIAEEITFSTTMTNIGTASAGAVRLGMYFSTDSIISTNDVFTTYYCSTSGMGVGEIWNCLGPIPVPAELSPGIYYFGVIADDLAQVAEFNEGNNTRSAQITLGAMEDSTPPTTPVELTANADGSSTINLSWGESTDSGGSGLAAYKIERCMGAGCTSFEQIAITTSTTLSNTGLSANTAYGYRVLAYDSVDNESEYSNTAFATTSAEVIISDGFESPE